MKLAKGTHVLVKAWANVAYIYGEIEEALIQNGEGLVYYPSAKTTGNPKGIWRTPCEPYQGIIIGWTHRAYGFGYPQRGDPRDWTNDLFEPACFEETGRVMGYMVESRLSDRYRVPRFCLPEDLEVEETCVLSSTT